MRKHIKKIILLTLFLLSLISLSYSNYGENDLPVKTKIILKHPPVILIHGFSGGEGTFANLINKFEYDGYASLTDKFVVRNNAQIDDMLNSYSDSPLIQVIFERNYEDAKTQVEWLSEIIKDVKYKYNTDKVILIGHSMGGLVATSYILETGGNDVQKLITLASPIIGTSKVTEIHNGLFTFLVPALNDLYMQNAQKYINDRRNLFNKNVMVFSVAGIFSTYDFNNDKFVDLTNDGVVDLKSQLLLSRLTKNFKGEACMCFHTDVQKNKQVIEKLEKFIYER